MTRSWFKTLIPAVAALAVIALTFSLGQWQLRRAEEKRQLGQARSAALAAPPLEFNDKALQDRSALQGGGQRQVRLKGEFEQDRTIFILNRTYQGKVGVHVVTPLRIAGTHQRVPVLRGWLPRDAGLHQGRPDVATGLKSVPEAVEIIGIAQADLGKSFDITRLRSIDPSSLPVPAANQKDWLHFHPRLYAQWLAAQAPASTDSASMMEVVDWMVRQTSDLHDGLVRDWPAFTDDVPKHQGYAAQWFGLSLTTAFLWFWFGFWRPRRKRSVLSSNTDG